MSKLTLHHLEVLRRRYDLPEIAGVRTLIMHAVLEIVNQQLDEEDAFINLIALLVCPTWTYQEQ